jgi:hypothetical protein
MGLKTPFEKFDLVWLWSIETGSVDVPNRI